MVNSLRLWRCVWPASPLKPFNSNRAAVAFPGIFTSRGTRAARRSPPVDPPTGRVGRIAGNRHNRIRSCRGWGLCQPQLRRRRPPGAQRIDFLVGGKPPGLLFREQQPAVDGDLEHPGHPGHQLDIGTVKLNQPRPRTEGPRFIVSRLAPLDRDLHSRPPLRPSPQSIHEQACHETGGRVRHGLRSLRRIAAGCCGMPADHAARPGAGPGPLPSARHSGVAFGPARREV